jgi:hypothetical protein
MLTGLSVWQLKDRGRTRPPKPPHPEPKEKPTDLPWYSLGEVRAFRKWRLEQAEITAVIAERKERQGPYGFSGWLAHVTPDPWPIALLGSLHRPVDAWSTIRGDVAMGRSDRIEWMTQDAYLDAMGAWVEAARVALEREAHEKLAGNRLKELEARVTEPGKPRGRG